MGIIGYAMQMEETEAQKIKGSGDSLEMAELILQFMPV